LSVAVFWCYERGREGPWFLVAPRRETLHSFSLFFLFKTTTSKQGRPKLPRIVARRRFREKERGDCVLKERVYRVFPSALRVGFVVVNLI